MAEDVRGLPRATFTDWLLKTVDGIGEGWLAEPISGGLSNITYRLTGADRTVIVRRPPLGKLLPSAHDMTREARVLRALRPTGVPVPEVLALCEDPEVVGAPFYVMAQVDGTVFREPAQTVALSPEQRSGLAGALVEVLATIHAVDLDATGLRDFGRPEGYLERQVRRWGGQWEASRTRDLPAMDQLVACLNLHRPEGGEVTLVHGDYRLDNTLVTLPSGQPQIAAVVDWELSTLGDPLADLATWLTYYAGPGEDGSAVPVAHGLTDLDGFPTTEEIASRYAQVTGRSVEGLDYYRAFTDFRLAVILEGVHARFLGGQALGEGYDRVGDSVPLLVERALSRLGGGR